MIIIVPGIGGSVLADHAGRPVWGDTRRRLVQLLRDPGRLSLEEAPNLIPTGLMASAGHVPPFRLHGYDGLIRALENGLDVRPVNVDVATPGRPGYEPDPRADVVLAPYDFRYGVRRAAENLAAEVGRRLEHLPRRDRMRRVIVVGHSMGGLVARYWAGLPGQAEQCRAVLTVGTPHRGSPKALDWLINGVGLGPGPIRDATRSLLSSMTELLRSWPAVYELLPTYQVIQDVDGQTMSAEKLGAHLPDSFAADTRYTDGLKDGATVHEEIARSWEALDSELRPVVVPFLARDHGTPHAATLDSSGLTVTDDDPSWQPNAGWRGDGTVPALSAVPPELHGREELQHPLRERHTPMASSATVVQVLRALTGERTPVRGGPVEGPRLGVDLADTLPLGEQATVRARLIGADGTGLHVWLLSEPADRSQPAHRQPMDPDGEGWVAPWTADTPGAWRLTVQVVGIPDLDNLAVSDTVGVLDLDGAAERPERGATDRKERW